MITKEAYGVHEGNEVSLFTLDNGKGLTAKITNYGGIITNLFYKGLDLVHGRDGLDEYLTNDGYFGAIIGRNSNRISGAVFELNGKTYEVYKNDGNNNLHGGKVGFDAKVWDAETVDADEPQLVLSLVSPDGEENFPGTATVKVTYTLTKDNSVKIHYEATCDKDTVMNLTNHSYFNLNGHDSGLIDDHTITVDSSFFTPNTDEGIPNGTVAAVDETPFDLRQAKKFSEAFTSDNEQIKMFNGFDHNFCLNGRGFRKVATLVGDKSGITMEAYTDCVGIQVYSGNMLDEDRVCKGGTVYKKHSAVCLETQTFPNAIKFPHFPTPILKTGEKFDTTTEYKFI